MPIRRTRSLFPFRSRTRTVSPSTTSVTTPFWVKAPAWRAEAFAATTAASRQSRAMSVPRIRRSPSFALTVAHMAANVNGPSALSWRPGGLAAHAGAAADPESLLQRAVFLAVLARGPDESGEHDDHAHDRDHEQEDAGGGVHRLSVPDGNTPTPRTNGPKPV